MFEELLLEYIRMRQQGFQIKDTLKALHSYVDSLDKSSREELSRKIRAWENTKMDMNLETSNTKHVPEEVASIRPTNHSDLSPDHWVECPNCAKKNRVEEYFCFKCGYLLDGLSDKFGTKHFSPATKELFSAEYFGEESVMIIKMRDVSGQMELRPQRFDRELIIGRGDSKSEMKPDVDLNTVQGRELGVSRLHIAVSYMPNTQVLEIQDLGSANGTRVNGQKLHSSERRILRHGDELRLGRCVLQVEYAHPGVEMP